MTSFPTLHRRDLLRGLSSGFGYLAFRSLAAAESMSTPHFEPKAKRVIFLCMRGGPSQYDTFDYKPRLNADGGKASRYSNSPLMPSLWDFKQRGESGLWISDAFPHLAQHADDLCLLRGMQCDQPAHAQAFLQMHTGTSQFVRPSMGAWTLYGLGSGNQNLPGFITLNPPTANGGAQNYGSSFLPTACQGTRFSIRDSSRRSRPIDILRRGETNDQGLSHLTHPTLGEAQQRAQLDFIKALNREKLNREVHAPLVEGAIASYELGFRMQSVVPDLMDLSGESEHTLALYGIDEDPTDGFGRQCLLARRMAEAGVRFIELGHGSWDQHANIREGMERNCAQTDKPIAGLLADLKQRDLLKDTLVLWGGEFGRTSHSPDGNGRDHNHQGFTMWMAGGGVKGGFSHGETDEHGYEAVAGKVHIHDWHATILHLLGLDHERLTFRFGGRDMRLTDLYGHVVQEILS